MVACPPSVEGRLRAPEIMTRAVGAGDTITGDDAATILDLGDRFDLMLLGPGLGSATGDLVSQLLTRWDGPIVLDADGLNAIASADVLSERTSATVLTPHAGEFARLTGRHASYDAAASFARQTGTIVLLKGSPTFVMGDDRWAVTSGGRELATIGTGDVLAGVLAAFIASGMHPEIAARSAAYWHGVAGASLARRTTVTADRLAEEISVHVWRAG